MQRRATQANVTRGVARGLESAVGGAKQDLTARFPLPPVDEEVGPPNAIGAGDGDLKARSGLGSRGVNIAAVAAALATQFNTAHRLSRNGQVADEDAARAG